MSLGMELLKTRMRNGGIVSCKKRDSSTQDYSSSADRKRRVRNNFNRLFDEECKLKGSFHNNIKLNVKTENSLSLYTYELQNGHLLNGEGDQPDQIKDDAKLIKKETPLTTNSSDCNEVLVTEKLICDLCGSISFDSIEAFNLHINTACHLENIKTISQKRVEAFERITSQSSQTLHILSSTNCSSSSVDEAKYPHWNQLLHYVKMQGLQLDFQMRGGFTGAKRNHFIFEVYAIVDGKLFSGVGMTLYEAKEDAATNALSFLQEIKLKDQICPDFIDDVISREISSPTDENKITSMMQLRKHLFILLQQINEKNSCNCQQSYENFTVSILKSLHELAEKDDRLLGAMPVGNTYKGIYLGRPCNCVRSNETCAQTLNYQYDIDSFVEMVIFCSIWPTRGFIQEIVDKLVSQIPQVSIYTPQLSKELDNQSYKVKAHFTLLSKWYDIRSIEQDCPHILAQDEKGRTPNISRDSDDVSCHHTQNLIANVRRFKRRIAVNNSSISVFQILLHLFHIHRVLVVDNNTKDACFKITPDNLESLLDYWLMVRTDAPIEWLFCHAMHSLAYGDNTSSYFMPASDTLLIKSEPKINNIQKNISDASVSVLAKYCIKLILNGRLLEAFDPLCVTNLQYNVG